MGNDLNLWRAAIGLHHGRDFTVSKRMLFKFNLFNFFIHSLITLLFYCKRWCIGLLFNVMSDAFSLQYYYVIVTLSLLKAGDIESNPGPTTNNGSSSLSILHCNIRSIRNKLEFITDQFSDFNILCFTETHLNPDVVTSEILLPSFDTPYRKDRTNHGGGLLVYLNNNLIHERLTDLETYCEESIWVKVKFKSDCFLIGLFYSPKTADVDFFNQLNINLEKALDISKNIIILGDLNENLLNPKFNNLRNIILIIPCKM